MKSYFALFWLLLAGMMSGCGNVGDDDVRGAGDVPVGFFVPRGVPPEIVGKVRFGMLNVATPEQVEQSFATARNASFQVILDLGPLIARPVSAESLSISYFDSTGVERRKVFEPASTPKVLSFPADEQLAELIRPYLGIMQRYQNHASAVFLADEPYLNGISRSEMERAARVVRSELLRYGLEHVKIGVIFASAMFEPAFARLIDGEAGEYVLSIDSYYDRNVAAGVDESFGKWVEVIRNFRLTTYDKAGNMYTGGGIPEGFDIIGFDYYVSTVLLDAVHERSLNWFAENTPEASCAPFRGQGMKNIRASLSFFQDGPVLQERARREQDRILLDQIFDCRIGAVTGLLQKALSEANSGAEILLVSESSNNGLLEFDARGNIEPGQPGKLVEGRVLDEVNRALQFYRRDPERLKAGVMFFTYDNEYDETIKLHIGGASGMPAVLDKIYVFAAGGKL